MDLLFTNITWLGSLYILLPLSVLLCLFLHWAGKFGQVILILLDMSVTIISVHVVKLMFRRPRPSTVKLRVTMPSDWSFPSAHTAQATAFFTSVTLIAFEILPPVWANAFALFCLLLVGIVGYSRVYLQVHYISDVLAGMFWSAFIIFVIRLVIPYPP